MNDRKLMQQALNALEQVAEYFNADSTETKTIIALRERLAQPDPVAYWHSEFLKYNTTSDHRMMENAQGELERIKLVQTGVGIGKPEQEPVAWLIWLHGPAGHFDHKQFAEMEFERRNKEYPDPDRKLLPLYTSPPASKPWVGLTDEERNNLWRDVIGWGDPSNDDEDLMKVIEAKLREKNA